MSEPPVSPLPPSKFRGLAKEAMWAFFVRALGTGSGFLMNLALARALGATEAGYYLLALAVIMFLSSFCRVGLDNTILRFVGANAAAGDWRAVNGVFRQSFLVVLTASVLVAAVVWVLSPWIAEEVFGKPDVGPALRAVAPGLVGLSLCFLLSYSLQAIRTVTGAVFSQSLGIAIGMVAISPLLAGAVAAGHAYTGISLAVSGLAFLWWRRAHPSEAGSFPSKTLWSSALPLWVVMCTTALQQWSGQFVAGAYVAPEELAQLAVAQRTAVLISFLLIAVNLVMAPRFAAFHQQGLAEDLRRVAQTSVRMILAIAGPFVFALLVAAEWIMRLFGPEFSEGANLLRILAVGQFVNAATGSVGYLLMMSGHERDMRNVALGVGPLAVVLALLLTPRFGATGAATATAIAVATQNLVAVYLVKRRLGFSTMAIWQR